MKFAFPLCLGSLLFACASTDESVTSDASTNDANTSSSTLPDGGTLGSADAQARPSGNTGYDSATPVATSDLGCTKMDVLFVIDNSASMVEEQAALVDSFPNMVEVLNGLRGGEVDYRIGVTTTSYDFLLPGFFDASNGALMKTADMTQPWLARGDSNLTARFEAVANVGTAGNPGEQPIRAAVDAVTKRVQDGKNAGFRRDDALLAIVMITDEDDGSIDGESSGLAVGESTPVDSFKTKLDTAAGGAGRWAVSAIAGAAGGCQSSYGEAADAERLREFVGLVGKNGVVGNICSGDLAGELKKALDTFTAACEDFEPLR